MTDAIQPVVTDSLKQAPPSQTDITEDYYNEIRVLGEGGFGQVVLCEDIRNGHLYAVKCLSAEHKNAVAAKNEFRKEAVMLKMVKQHGGHPNIVGYFFARSTPFEFQIFLEYTEGGELYDLIEPDGGIPAAKAQNFFSQLLTGVEFLHSLSIVHRDIKPENLLLTKDGVLKICDFGLSAYIKSDDGSERWLNTPCGSAPYAAPEVLRGRYRGIPADIWSCGVVLAVLLTGELPWSRPDRTCRHFVDWIQKTDMERPAWKKLDSHALSVLRMILVLNPEERPTIERIKKHPWMSFDHSLLTHANAAKRRKLIHLQNDVTVSSQPVEKSFCLSPPNPLSKLQQSFTQPDNAEELLLSQTQYTQTQDFSKKDALYRMARRMTRFCVNIPQEAILKRLLAACSACNFIAKEKKGAKGVISVTSTYEMDFVISVFTMSSDGKDKVLVDFRRSRGGGLDFKRAFLLVRAKLEDVICKAGEQWLHQRGLTQPMPTA